jgi:hypothetical protein
MNKIDLNNLAESWIAGQDCEPDTPEYKDNWWAIEQIIDWSLEGEDELLWQFILITYRRDMSDRVAAVFAAGPLEDLLAKHGQKYIDRIEKLALEDEKFNMLLGGVWHNTMTSEVWNRVQTARKQVW